MKLIIGLGNPGPKYQFTRHNTGFLVLDALAKKLNVEFKFSKKFNADIARVNLKKEKNLLIKPQTLMNNSGQTVQTLVSFYKLNPNKDITIIYDDIDLPLGKFKITGHSSAGHKGMQSIINNLNTQDLKRFRVGTLNIEKKQIQNTSNYVLAKFSKQELKNLNQTIKQIINQITNA